MNSRYVTGPLASLQFGMLLLKGAFYLAGRDLSWGIVLWPLWVLLLAGVVFWVLFAALVSKAG